MLEIEQVLVREQPLLGQSVDRDLDGRRPGTDDDVLRPDVRLAVLAVDGDDVWIVPGREACPTAYEVDLLVFLHLRVLAPGEVVASRADPLQRIGLMIGRRMQQRFGGNAPDVRAVAADSVAFDQHDVVAESGEADRKRQATGAGSDDRCLVGVLGVVADHRRRFPGRRATGQVEMRARTKCMVDEIIRSETEPTLVSPRPRVPVSRVPVPVCPLSVFGVTPLVHRRGTDSPATFTRRSSSRESPMDTYSENLAVLCGPVANEPTSRELPGGGRVVSFDVATRPSRTPQTRMSVPVAWYDPTPSALASLDGAFRSGHGVVVIGSVRRRFFRSGGSTQSRTEVVADRVVPATRRKTLRSVLGATADALIDGPRATGV